MPRRGAARWWPDRRGRRGRRASACARRRGRSRRPARARSPSPRWRRRPPSPGARARPGGRRAGGRSRPRGARPRAGPAARLRAARGGCAPRRSHPSSTAQDTISCPPHGCEHRCPAGRRNRPGDHRADPRGPLARGRLRLRRAPVRRRVDRRARDRADRRDAGRLPRGRTPSCWPRSAGRSGTAPIRSAPRPEQGLLGLRKALGLYANLRPVRAVEALLDASPLRREVVERTDLLVVRELTGGIYFGEKTRTDDSASDLCVYTTAEIERIARVAFGAARSKVTSVDKANVLETSRLWREVVRRVHARGVPAGRARARARRLDRDEAHHRPAPLRRDPHREHVRRHPQRRGVGGHGLARAAAQRLDRGRPATPGSSSPSTAPRRTSPGRGSPTRWPCSCRPR